MKVEVPLYSRHSSRSDRSGGDYDRRDYYRDTPSRDAGGRRRSSRDGDYHYNNSRVKEKMGELSIQSYQLLDSSGSSRANGR